MRTRAAGFTIRNPFFLCVCFLCTINKLDCVDMVPVLPWSLRQQLFDHVTVLRTILYHSQIIDPSLDFHPLHVGKILAGYHSLVQSLLCAHHEEVSDGISCCYKGKVYV